MRTDMNNNEYYLVSHSEECYVLASFNQKKVPFEIKDEIAINMLVHD